MAEKTQVVGTNDKGQFVVNIPRGDIARVDVVDIDFVIQTKSGARLIIPGAAMDSMTASPPAIQFADGPLSSGALLATVQKVDTPPTSIPVMSSLTQYELKKSEGNKNVSRDGPEGRDADAATQEAMSQQVAPLPTEGGDSSVDKLLAKAEQLADDITKNAFDWAPNKPLELPGANPDGPPGQPPTAKIPLLISLSIGNVVSDGAGIVGQGGPAGSGIANGILNNDALQYGTETLTGGAGDDTIYADALTDATGVDNTTAYSHLDTDTGLATDGTAFYFVKDVAFNVAGYLRRVTSITISGLPDGVSIEGATSLGNGSFSLPSSLVIPIATVLNFIYDVTVIRALFPTGSDHVDINLTFNIKGYGVGVVDATKIFVLRFQDVDSTTDITANNPIPITGIGGGYSDIYVMPTASTPHLINAGGGNNVVYAGNSNDTINAGSGNDVIYAYAGNDVITVGGGDNTVWAGSGDDNITTGAGADVIQAGSGNDSITASTGNNVIAGGTGTDTLSFVDADISSVTLTLDANGDRSGVMSRSDGGADTITGIENIKGSSGNDNFTFIGSGNVANTVWGGSGNDRIDSGDGNDTVYGETGDDTIIAGTGDDVIDGGADNDTITGGAGADTLIGGVGNDIFLAVLGDGADVYDGGDDLDKVDYTAETAAITINLGNSAVTGLGGSAAGDTYRNIEWIVGGSGADNLTAAATACILDGGAGNDVITGGGGDDTLYGGIGTDTLTGGAGANVLDGGAGTNTYNMGAGADQVIGGANYDRIYYQSSNIAVVVNLDGASHSFVNSLGTTVTVAAGSGGNRQEVANDVNSWANGDTYSGVEEVQGSSVNDVIWGSDAVNNVFTLNSGNDIAYGFGGNDTLYGGAGTDTLYGGVGNDVLEGGAGGDTLDGGAGVDQAYYYNSSAGVTVDLYTASTDAFYKGVGGDAASDVFSDIENLSGSNNAGDTLIGDTNANILWGNGGDDFLKTVAAVKGAAYVNTSGADTLFGGAGKDSLYIAKEEAASNTVLTTVDGGAGLDTLYAANWDFSSFSNNRYVSIEAVNLKGLDNITTQALTNAVISQFLDSSPDTANTLKLYLDNGDTFNATNASGSPTTVSDGVNSGLHYTYTGATTYYVDVYKTA